MRELTVFKWDFPKDKVTAYVIAENESDAYHWFDKRIDECYNEGTYSIDTNPITYGYMVQNKYQILRVDNETNSLTYWYARYPETVWTDKPEPVRQPTPKKNYLGDEYKAICKRLESLNTSLE